MEWNAVLREDMGDEGICNVYGSGAISSWNESTLLGEAVNNHQNCCKAVRQRQLLNEVHADRMPWSLRDRKGLQKAVRTMVGWFIPRAEDALRYEILAVGMYCWPGIVSTEEF